MEAAAPARRGRPSTGARERILEAAIEVLKSDGYAGLTIAKVAADQRGQPAAQTAFLVGGLGLRRTGFFGKILVFAGAMWRLWRAFLPNHSDEFSALLAQDALHAADGVALAVQEMANAAQKIDVVGTIIAPPAAALHRLDVAETAFPKSQHVLRQIEFVCHFTDAAKCVRRLVIQSGPSRC